MSSRSPRSTANSFHRKLVHRQDGFSLGRKQQRLGRRFGGDAVEFWVTLAERLGDFHFCAGEQVDELQRVYDGFSFEMIVGDDEGGVAAFGHVLDARGPGLEFLLGVEVVVALRGRRGGIVAEPGVVAAAVQADVGDAGGRAFASASSSGRSRAGRCCRSRRRARAASRRRLCRSTWHGALPPPADNRKTVSGVCPGTRCFPRSGGTRTETGAARRPIFRHRAAHRIPRGPRARLPLPRPLRA